MAIKSARDLMLALTDEDAAILHNTTSTGFPVACDMQRGDVTDYRTMLRREQDNRKWAGCYERPGHYVTRLEAHPEERK